MFRIFCGQWGPIRDETRARDRGQPPLSGHSPGCRRGGALRGVRRMDQWTRLDPVYDSEAAARAIAASAPARADAQDHDDGFPLDDIADLARLGLLAAPVPVDHGGAGLGTE